MLALFLNARFQVTEQTIGYFFMYVGAISVFARVLLLGRMVDWLGEAKLSRLGLVLLAAGVLGMPLARNLGMLACCSGTDSAGYSIYISLRHGTSVPSHYSKATWPLHGHATDLWWCCPHHCTAFLWLVV